jgi:fatty acid desaturase
MAGPEGANFGAMSPHGLRRDVKWRDLLQYRPIDTIVELLLPAPWLAGTVLCAGQGFYPLALVCTFFLFLTLLRVAHNGYHNALGLGRRATNILILLLSPLMMLPLHAVKLTHLEHHRHCLGAKDIEGEAGRKTFWAVVAYGPRFPIDVMRAAWRRGGPEIRRWICAECALIAGVWIAALTIGWPALIYHGLAMSAGECATAFFAVWIVHHGVQDQLCPARTQRGWLKNAMTYSMFLHAEHHLFPAVPTFRLREPARRLDRAAPNLLKRQVF